MDFEREELSHLESTGEEILIIESFMRLATAREIDRLLSLGERLLAALVAKGAARPARTIHLAASRGPGRSAPIEPGA